MGGWRTLCKGRISSNSLIVVKVREKKVVERERNNNDRGRRVFEALATGLSASNLYLDHMENCFLWFLIYPPSYEP